MQVAWEYFPTEESEVAASLDRAVAHMDEHSMPYALVMKKGSVAPVKLQSKPVEKPPGQFTGELAAPLASRHDVLLAIQAAAPANSVLIATTGYTGRELYACADKPNQIYMVGSMGCAVSLGLGIALAQPERPVIVLDGDGAALMRLGAQSIVGYEAPDNLTHVLLDNAIHESTGGQATVSRSVNFPAIAAACGYASVQSESDTAAIQKLITGPCKGPRFLHVPTLPGVPEGLPRPSVTPAEVAVRFREFLNG
jgi:phosphonopyruvate decarboxylase